MYSVFLVPVPFLFLILKVTVLRTAAFGQSIIKKIVINHIVGLSILLRKSFQTISKMVPRRSLRIRRLNSRSASTAIALRSSTNATSKSTENAAEKRTYIKIMAEADTSVNVVAVQPKLKKMKFNNDNNDPIAPFVLLPFEVLEQIFIKVDDTGLLNLADTCTRFESIALTVASKRYADRYFVINSERFGGDRDVYEAIFNRFGIYINAIEINHSGYIDAHHWMAKMLRPHINHITKLTLNNCAFYPKNMFSRILHKITHLEIFTPHRSFGVCNIDISKCRKLVRLVIREWYGSKEGMLKQIMRNNPGLQSIFHTEHLHLKSIQEYSILDHSSQLKEVGDLFFDGKPDIRPGAMDQIVHTLKNLESLGIKLHSDMIGPMQRLGSECKRIKQLKLRRYYSFRWNDETIEAVRSFQQIESLYLANFHGQIDKIVLAVKNLPNLRHLRFGAQNYSLNANFPFADIFPLLRECPSLQTITVSMTDVNLNFICTQFFAVFLEIVAVTAKSSARIEIEIGWLGKIVAVINANGIVCRNKLIHWMGCDNIPESSDKHLLKLANIPVKSDVGREQSRAHVLDWIFDYLDVTCLYLFAESSPRSKQLVENYIKVHSKQNGLFTITNEFHPFHSWRSHSFIDFRRMHQMFAPHVTNLKIHNINRICDSQHFLQNYNRLNKVSVYDEEITDSEPFPKSVRYLVLDGLEYIGSSELHEIMRDRRGTLELKNASAFNDFVDRKNFHGIFKKSQLKTLMFNYRGETQYENLKRMFDGSKTKLVPIFYNSHDF